MKNSTGVLNEASISKIGRTNFYFQQRGIDSEEAIKLMISGFCRDVFSKLPMEFVFRSRKAFRIKIEKLNLTKNL